MIQDRDLAIGAATSVGFRVASLADKDNSTDGGIELAEYLHNSLQSELFGIAKHLEAASLESSEVNTRVGAQDRNPSKWRSFRLLHLILL